MLKPLNDHIVVQRLEQESVSKGGIIIPDTAKEKPAKGVVVAVGTGKRAKDGSRMAMDVKAGDVVLFGKYSGSEVKLNGKEYMILREDDVLAVVEE
ncbi:MAG: co-chaperone GroES [Proteobacteria bacterium]|nr:co-chaperone GroES [Pseudomonadota bacterium]MBQ4360906.1 co-chaperone GroES [Pseudomonadota bacterium]